jgi:hypothetical protein
MMRFISLKQRVDVATLLLRVGCAALFLLSPLHTTSAQPVLEWSARFDGPASGDDFGRDLKVDAAGNVYMAGAVMTADSGRDFGIVKFDASGRYVWTTLYNGDANIDDWAQAIAVDLHGNVYATGYCQTMTQGQNYITIKCDVDGAILWASEYDGSAGGNDAARAIAIGTDGRVCVTGISQNENSNADYLTLCYDTHGKLLWSARYNGPGDGVDDARALVLDADNNVYVSGGSTGEESGLDFTTIKYGPDGTQLWESRYNGPANGDDIIFYPGALVVDEHGIVYATGYSKGVDGDYDYATVRYEQDGQQSWVARYGSAEGGVDYANCIQLDGKGNVYVTGGSDNGVSEYDIVTVCYSEDGSMRWKATYNGSGNGWDEGYGIQVDSALNVYVIGRSEGATSSADIVLLMYDSTGANISELRYEETNGYDWPFVLEKDGTGALYAGGYVNAFSSAPGGADFIALKYTLRTADVQLDGPGSTWKYGQVYPNPVADVTRLPVTLQFAEQISITIHTLDGRRVGDTHYEYYPPGDHVVELRTSDLSAGRYFYVIQSRIGTVSRGFLKVR